MDYSSILKPRGASVYKLVFQNSSLLSGSNGSVLSIKVISTLFKRPSWSSLKKWSCKYFGVSSSPLSALCWQFL